MPNALPLLKKTMPLKGSVALVGAGPGDPELLTIKALRRIEQADIVVYDDLVGPEILKLIPATTRKIYVGKRCGRHSFQQEAINFLLVRLAQSGKQVVRLKGGDPFVFGRGGEELEALQQQGIGVEVVPGITAAMAAGASLGLPLTHRGTARRLTLLTGHVKNGILPEETLPEVWDQASTYVVYMGKAALAKLADQIIKRGGNSDIPAIAIENVSLPTQRHILGTIATLPQLLDQAKPTGPTLIIIGKVVDHAAFTAKPTSDVHPHPLLTAKAG